MKQEVICELKFFKWCHYTNNEVVYTCEIKNQTIIEDAELEFKETHKDGNSNLDVTAIIFDECTITKVPQGLTKSFPNLKALTIRNSKLKQIERKDLKDLSQLERLSLSSNEITFLCDDLLSDMECLEYLSFYNNKMKIIEPNLLDGLHKLIYVSFSSNPCIDMRFDSINNNGNATLEEIKQAIRQKYLNEASAKLKLKSGISSDLKRATQNEKLKDFTVKVEEEEFKMHKFLLVARSSTILEMIENNVDAESLNLDDISAETFRVIYNFFYTDELPDTNAYFINLLMAADKLKIDKLKELAVEKLIEKINAENAIEMLKFANKYEHEKLRRKAFEHIKKTIGDEFIDAYLVKQPDLLKTLIQVKKEQDEMNESDETA